MIEAYPIAAAAIFALGGVIVGYIACLAFPLRPDRPLQEPTNETIEQRARKMQ